MTVPLWAWAAFGAVVLIMLTIDLLAHRGAHIIKFKEAAIWSAVWVGLSLIFAVVIFFTLGADAGRRLHHRLAAGEITERRQPLRLRADLRLLQGPA